MRMAKRNIRIKLTGTELAVDATLQASADKTRGNADPFFTERTAYANECVCEL
jgi:hypothetical protein